MDEFEREKKKPSTAKLLIGTVCIGAIIIVITLIVTVMIAVNQMMAQYPIS